MDGKIELPLATHGNAENLEPYRTCWDAMGDLDNDEGSPDLNPTGKWAGLLKSIPEGKKLSLAYTTRCWGTIIRLADAVLVIPSEVGKRSAILDNPS